MQLAETSWIVLIVMRTCAEVEESGHCLPD